MTFSRKSFVILLVVIVASVAAAGVARAQEAKKAKTWAEPQWVDSNRTEPGGTKYHTFASAAAGSDVSYLIYLPPAYDQETARRFPVIYWLHGLGGNQRAAASMFVPRLDEAIRQGSVPPAIVVCVNGMVSSFYCDWANGKRPVESVIVKDLIPHIDQTYRTIADRDGRVIQGFSMGGFGAGHLGFKYPELFGTVVVDAGALIGEIALKGPNIAPIFEGGFNSDLARFQAEQPTQLAAQNADKIRGKTRIRIGCGGDDSLLPRNRELHELLTKLNIEHEYEVVPDVAHNPPQYYTKLGDKAFTIHRQAFEALAATKK